MTDRYLITVLEEAEYVAEQHHQVARTADNPGPRVPSIRCPSDTRRAGRPLTDGLDADRRRHCRLRHRRGDVRQLGLQRGLVGDCPTAGIVYPLPGVLPGRPSDRPTDHRRRDGRARCLASLERERSRVWLLRPSRARREVHYLWPEGHPVEEVLHERLSGPAEAVAPDGGRTGDVRDRLVVDDDPQPQDDLEPRTKRAIDEAMDVSLLSKVVATRSSPRPVIGTKSTSSTSRVLS